MKNVLAATLLVSLIICQTSAKIRRRRQGFVFPDEGPSCRTPSNRRGDCIPLRSCESFRRSTDFELLKNSICGYDRDEPRICCPSNNRFVTEAPVVREPTTTTTPPEPVSPRIVPTQPPVTNSSALRNLPIVPKDCGVSTVTLQRIVGGEPSQLGTWPWMAAVYITRTGLRTGTDCGGALVTARHVITAAHCVTDRRGNQMRASDLTVRLGEHILNNDTDGASPIDVPIVKVVRHENFQRRVFKNDIAILTLNRDVSFNRLIRPICLPNDEIVNLNLAGRQPFVAGWGTTAFEGEYNPHLSHIQIRVQTNEDCHRAYQSERVPITREYLCAGVGDGTKDSCQGDSGGPLMLPLGVKYYLIGVVSFGKRCAEVGFPGVYTRVTMYLDWIARNLT